MKLTKQQEKILDEIQQIRDIAYDYSNIEDDEVRTVMLEIEREALVRNRVLLDCLLIEEAMGEIIMDYILQDSPKWKTVEYFGRIKRYRLFYDEILGHIPPFQKLDILKQIIKIPKNLEKTIRKIFNLRNVFSHVLTIDYTKARKVQYDGKSIFEIGTFKKYIDDAKPAVVFLLEQIKL